MSTNSRSTITLPAGFEFNEVKPGLTVHALPTPNPPLGTLAALAGATFTGPGFNTIFRPQNAASVTPLPTPQPSSDNILELNLTEETLAFAGALGNVPNRGAVQKDLFLNGVPYVQTINDVTVSGQSPTIHFEPGLWLAVPATTNPVINEITYVRQASIPHGVTIQAIGTSSAVTNGKPNIPAVDITPFFTNGHAPQPFPSQTAAAQNTARLPQDLTSYIASGMITQAILSDPNTVLRNAIAGQNILNFTTLNITTDPTNPLFGGGTDNMPFLLGANGGPNANAIIMNATFWIETVEETIIVPPFKPGQPPLTIKGVARPQTAGAVPVFTVKPPIEILQPRPITVTFTQVQYSQVVNLVFGPLTWPHVSVATLSPADPIEVPPSVWA